MSLLGWESLIFLIPLGVGGVLALGAALGGLGEGDGDDHGDGAEADHGDHAGTWLALGRVPVTVRVLLLTLPFGSVGLASTYLLSGMGNAPGVRAAIAVVVAAVATWWIAGWTARLFRERVRMVETETIGRRELVGSAGTAVLGIGPSSGLAQVKDRRGNLHQVTARTLSGEESLKAGVEVLVVDYDEAGKLYYVTANPAAAPMR